MIKEIYRMVECWHEFYSPPEQNICPRKNCKWIWKFIKLSYNWNDKWNIDGLKNKEGNIWGNIWENIGIHTHI